MNHNREASTGRWANPFYVLLVITGIAFCITACAFGVMTVKGLQPAVAANESESGRRFLQWMDQHGFRLMLIELAVLAVATVAAIGTDQYWSQRES